MNPVLWFFLDRPGLLAGLLPILLMVLLGFVISRLQQKKLARQRAEQEELARQRSERRALPQVQSIRSYIPYRQRVKPKRNQQNVKTAWYEQSVVEQILIAILTPVILLSFYLPLIAAIIVGATITHYNWIELHHPVWLSILYGFWLPVLLASLFYGMFRNQYELGKGSEVGCGCGFLFLMLFFAWWPVCLKVIHQSRPTSSVTHNPSHKSKVAH